MFLSVKGVPKVFGGISCSFFLQSHLHHPIAIVVAAWIQNMAEPRRIGRVGKVLELGDSRFHAAIAAIWHAIAVLERFCHTATETEIATETAF